MGGSDENNPGVIKPPHFQGDTRYRVEATQNQRRALGSIDQNTVGATLYPCVFDSRELSDKKELCEKNSLMLAHRPIIRKFAAQIESKQQHCADEAKKPSQSSLNPSGLQDCIVTDVEEYKKASNIPVPAFVKHTKAILDDIDRMEVEMDDVVGEPILDIDSCDMKNPLAVVEYIEDIYAYYREIENSSCVSPNYMAHQFDINDKMRAILIDWLIEVHYKFELMGETLFLAANIIDRFLERQTVVRKKLQLVGVTAMLLACKYEEVSVPVVEDFVLISDKAYTKREVLDMEKLMLNKLQFNMSVATPYVFMTRFLKAAQSDKKLELLSFFIIELCLVEYEMLKFPPSLLAAAAIYTARCSLDMSKQWSKTSEWHTNYSEDQLLECSRMMVKFHQKAGVGKLTGVYRKYSQYKFGCVAKSEPAQFLLDHKWR